MCRLFGFKSVITSQVHSSLANADNSLKTLSEKHPDGWGIAFYREDTPHLIRSSESALTSTLFQKIASSVRSQTVIAHIRKATFGEKTVLNSHPFQYGRWTFAHNGNIKDFATKKNNLEMLICPKLLPYVLGTTDSEVFFYIILSYIQKEVSLNSFNISLQQIWPAIEKAITDIHKIIGELTFNKFPHDKENYLSFILTNGDIMCGFQGGQELYFCTHKSKCPERDSCRFFNTSCENKSKEAETINHLLISSSPFMDYNIWQEITCGEFVGTDANMSLFKKKIKNLF